MPSANRQKIVTVNKVAVIENPANFHQSQERGTLLTLERLPQAINKGLIEKLESTEFYRKKGEVWFYLSDQWAVLEDGLFRFNKYGKTLSEMFEHFQGSERMTFKERAAGVEPEPRKSWLALPFEERAISRARGTHLGIMSMINDSNPDVKETARNLLRQIESNRLIIYLDADHRAPDRRISISSHVPENEAPVIVTTEVSIRLGKVLRKDTKSRHIN